MEPRYDSCTYRARREFLGVEFDIKLFDVDASGIAVVALQQTSGSDASLSPPLKFARVFSSSELRVAGICKTLEGFVALVDALELVEDAYFTAQDAVESQSAEISELAAFQLSAALPGIARPPPIVSQAAAMAYFTRAPVGSEGSSESSNPLLLDVVAKGLTELCRAKPAGTVDAVTWLGNWFLNNNPTHPSVQV
uniref:Uncharacterized protein n=1 Tax=Globisporangium ultimum (strain ATCC 200006 / CBS 805.95 / DAOM BR144) TaxID=431595 RepID=K3WSZ7_GLOUD